MVDLAAWAQFPYAEGVEHPAGRLAAGQHQVGRAGGGVEHGGGGTG